MAKGDVDNVPIGIISFILLLANIYFSYQGSRILFELNFWQAGLMSLGINFILILLNVYLQQKNYLLIFSTLLAFVIACWYDLKIVTVGFENMLKLRENGSVLGSVTEAHSWTGLLLSIVILCMTVAFSFVAFEQTDKE